MNEFRALLVHCTLRSSPPATAADDLGRQLLDALRQRGAATEEIRAVDHLAAVPGPHVRDLPGLGDDADVVVVAAPVGLGRPLSVCELLLARLATSADPERARRTTVVLALVGDRGEAGAVASSVAGTLRSLGFRVPTPPAAHRGPHDPRPTDVSEVAAAALDAAGLRDGGRGTGRAAPTSPTPGAPVQLPRPRGPVSAAVVGGLRGGPFDTTTVIGLTTAENLRDADVQLAMWVAFEVGYRGFDDADPDAERDLRVLAWRHDVERRLEDDLRRRTATMVEAARAGGRDVAQRVASLVREAPGTPLNRHLQRHAPREHLTAFLAERSIYHLKETDPQARVLAWIDGPAKVAHAELLYDEYGSGHPERLHSRLYAEAMRAAGLDATYGAYIDSVDATTLLSNNVMALFGSQRRLRGAALGHLAAFEATSTDPCRRVAAGAERLGFPPAVAAYFHEHVEADAVHEQVVLGDICGAAVATDPSIEDDVLLGAATCLLVDAEAAQALHDRLVAGDPHPAPGLRVVRDERAAS